jgi:hypothetical protein
VLHAGDFCGFGYAAPESPCYHRQQRIMPYVDRPIIIQPDKVQRRLPRTRCNPEKLLAINIPSARRLVPDGHIDPAVDDGIEEMLVVKIVRLPGRYRVVAANRQHAFRGDFAKRHMMRETDLCVRLQRFDGVVGTDVRLEQMQVGAVGPLAIEREAGRPYAAQIPETNE